MTHRILSIFKVVIYTIVVLFVLLSVSMVLFPGHPGSGIANGIFRTVCHRGDSLVLLGIAIELPLCYRCSGIYLFLLAGMVTADVFGARISGKFHFGYIIAGVLPMIADGFFKLSANPSLGWLSFLTGGLFGLTCGLCAIHGFNGLLHETKRKAAGTMV